jgi:hypothetical protein
MLLFVLLSAVGPAQPEPPTSRFNRPAYTDRRFDEDWSVLRDVDLRDVDRHGLDGVFDRLKFVPLNERGNVWLTFAGQVRERLEGVRAFQLGASQPEASDAYLLSRIRVSADFHASRYFRVFAEAKSSLATRRDLTGGDSASFVDDIDLQNGFADVTIPLRGHDTLTLRAGRQELLFGTQRVVGPSDYTNVRRTFQGFSAIARTGAWRITPFWTQLVIVQTHAFDQGNPDRTLYGAYATRAASHNGANVDLYWLGANNSPASFNGTTGPERRQTFGGRLWRDDRPGTTDFDLEVAGQFGAVGGEDARGSMVSANGGYTFTSRFTPHLFATFDYASGDGQPGGRVGTFNELYPTNHTFLGNTDYIGRQNIISPSAGVDLHPLANLSIVATQYFFWRASLRDAVYDSSSAVLRPGTGSDARYVGAEINVVATYHFDRHLLGYASYNHFFPGAFIRATGPSRGSDYVYGALQFTF